MRQLRGRRRFTGTVDTDDQNYSWVGRQGTNRWRIDRQNAADFFACYFADIICGNPRERIALLQTLHDPQSHGHADIGANQRFLEFVPIDRFAGESVDDVLEKFHAANPEAGPVTETPGRLRSIAPTFSN